jgi:hypothetical protein
MNDITAIYGGTLPAEQVFRYAQEKSWKGVVIAGWSDDGEFLLFSNFGAPESVVYTAAQVQHEILTGSRMDT